MKSTFLIKVEKELKICSHLIILTTFLLKSFQLRGDVGGGGRQRHFSRRAWVEQEEGEPLTGMNNGTGAEVAEALSADSALSSTHWLLQEVAPPACTCLPSLGYWAGLGWAGAGQEPGLRLPREQEKASLGSTVSFTAQVGNRPGEAQ